LSVVSFAWRDKPSLIERLLPAQKISAEAQKERKAGAGQTLTALGSYWKGRKPLILVKACILGALLPATDNPEADLEVFEKLMAIDDEAFLRREFRPSCLDLVKRLHPRGEMQTEDAERLFEVRRRTVVEGKTVWEIVPFVIDEVETLSRGVLRWREAVGPGERSRWELRWVQSFSYLERVGAAKRPEELDQDELFEPVWSHVNAHLGTEAGSLPELVEQLGILRFGTRPRVGDTFCGGGSIPFEAARMGCDVYASDLNPIACMLTWGALNIIGAPAQERREIERALATVGAAVDREITELGIEHDRDGNRAKAYLYCVEVRCPQTGFMVPLAPSWVISRTRNVIARLVPNNAQRRFEIEILSGVSEEEMSAAREGTMQDGDVVYTLGNETYRTKFKIIRGDVRRSDGVTQNKLRLWEKADFKPREEDILQERLYCVQWITRDTFGTSRQESFFAAVSEQDLVRERKVESIVRENLELWQTEGLVPDMPIEVGDKTDEPIRTRGWTYWHHLAAPRQLLLFSLLKSKSSSPAAALQIAKGLDRSSRLCRWNPGSRARPGVAPTGEKIEQVFDNQAFNPQLNYGCRSASELLAYLDRYEGKRVDLSTTTTVETGPATGCSFICELFVTDPPYADAIRYEEITEYFIAWLRRNPPAPFDHWVWDSRRPLAIKGAGDDFRRDMTAAYRAMSDHMPDNGLQIVMFTHQDASVWADMAAIVWGAGLQVTAAWYIATETVADFKQGGYVQGTVLLVLRKRLQEESAYRDELVQEVRAEVARQIETMTGLNQSAKGAGRSENLFEDQDLQMAGYAAALRVLTGYSRIDGQDMAAEALRPKQAGGRDMVKEIIDFAVQVANEHLVPEGIAPGLWERLSGPERFYLRMLDIEAGGAKKLDNYQNFAKAFRYGDYTAVMASMKANDARLKTALDLKRAEFEGEFGKSALRAVLFALYELQREVDIDEAIGHLRDLVPGYLSRRDDLMALASAIAAKREVKAPAEAQAARILLSRIKSQRLG
jgi:putative DNA methylase